MGKLKPREETNLIKLIQQVASKQGDAGTGVLGLSDQEKRLQLHSDCLYGIWYHLNPSPTMAGSCPVPSTGLDMPGPRHSSTAYGGGV